MVTRDKRNATMTMVITAVAAILAILVVLYVVADAMKSNYGTDTTPYSSGESDSEVDDGMVSSSFQTSFGSSAMNNSY